MKKILFVTDVASPWGGSEELWSKSAIAMKSDGYDVYASVGYFGQVHYKIQNLINLGVIVSFRKSKVRKLMRKGLVSMNKEGLANKYATDIEKTILSVKPKLVMFSQSSCYSAYKEMLFCKKNGVKYCSVSQLNTEFVWPNDGNFRQIQEAFLNSEKPFFVSMGNLNLFRTQIACSLPDAEVISNPFNFDAIPELEWPPEDKIRLACVARLSFNHKGTDILLETFAQPQWKDRNFELNFYGDGDVDLAKATAGYLGTHNINFIGHVDSIVDIWKINHGIVMASRYEGMPLSIIEAMFCKRVVITTDVGGHGEYIEDGIDGYVALAPKTGLFSKKMEQAWDELNTWKSKGEKARDKVKQIATEDPVDVFKNKLTQILERS
tara:strand:- start:296 stop:1432 length:1137 start_codon:yes stop_codon:yes gene_type:complete